MTKLLAPLLALTSALPAGFSAREKSAVKHIEAAGIAAHTRFLSDDLLEGRGPGSRGGELAMRYIAAQYERLGLVPMGAKGDWQQPFDIVGLRSKVTTPLTGVGVNGQKLALQPLTDSMVASGVQAPTAAVHDAELVFVGYGITAPEQQWDDFKGVDVRGKVLLVMNNDPEDDPRLFAGKTRLYYGRWDYKYEEAARHGAAGVIIIHTEHSAGYPWQVVQSSWSGEQFELPTRGEPRLQLKMWATEEASRRLVKLGGQDLDALRRAAEKRDFRPVRLGVKVTAALSTQLTHAHTANVLGLLPGSDPKLKDEWVVVTAHHDHLGVREEGQGDRIYNGAADNAAGVAGLLELAEAITAARPRRSVLFAAVGAEESGLLGSQYLCEHPPVPPGRIAATLNIDGLNIWGRTKDIAYIGMGKSTLDDVVVKVARAQGRVVTPDNEPDKGGFYRSDQFNFAKIGVPALYLEPGVLHPGHDAAWGRAQHEAYTKERYHQVNDVMDQSWKLDGAEADVRLMAVALLRIANAAKMPAWHEGDEFAAARQRALTAVQSTR